MAILFIGYCVFGIWQTAKEAKPLRIGRDGERAVAEQLDVVKGQGAFVFHDRIADGFNLHHVVLSRQGIFVVETKTHTKPAKESLSVTFDRETLLFNGFKPERNPITQVQGNTK